MFGHVGADHMDVASVIQGHSATSWQQEVWHVQITLTVLLCLPT